MIRPRARQAVAAVLAAALAALATSACRRRDSRGYEGPYAGFVVDAIPRIERGTGLEFKTPPKLEIRSKAQVRSFIERAYTEPEAARELRAQSAVWKRLGLIPDTLEIARFLTDLLEEQIVGYYDPPAKTLFIVEGVPEPAIALTVTHELVHALQDQYLNLDSVIHVRGQNDRVRGAQSVLEGQATYVQVGANVAQLGGWDRARELIREQQGAMPRFSAAPTVLQETLIFPYLSGAEFMRRFYTARPDSSPFGDLPTSSEQIIHTDAYFTRRDAPTRITLPPTGRGDGASSYENDLGEFEIRVLLYEHLRDQNAAVRGAQGWDGDRYALVDGPRGQVLAWVSVWDSTVDAAEFYDAMNRVVEVLRKRPGASGRTLAVISAEIQGRPAVLYTDAPAGVDARGMVPLGEVKLAQ